MKEVLLLQILLCLSFEKIFLVSLKTKSSDVLSMKEFSTKSFAKMMK